ncbi:MAG: cupin-like domain-containing protein [Asticcacaulis sp.]
MSDGNPVPFAGLARIPDIDIADPAELDAHLKSADRPFVVRGLVSGWPLVQAGRRSGRDARDYLLRRRRDTKFIFAIGEPESRGRLFYNSDMGMNFRTLKAKLPEIFAQIDAAEGQPDAPPIYVASIDVHDFFSGLHEGQPRRPRRPKLSRQYLDGHPDAHRRAQ